MACDCSGPCGEAARLAAILGDLRRFKKEIIDIDTKLNETMTSISSFQNEIPKGFAKDDLRTDGPLTDNLKTNITNSKSTLSSMSSRVDEKIAYYEPLYRKAQDSCDVCLSNCHDD